MLATYLIDLLGDFILIRLYEAQLRGQVTDMVQGRHAVAQCSTHILHQQPHTTSSPHTCWSHSKDICTIVVIVHKILLTRVNSSPTALDDIGNNSRLAWAYDFRHAEKQLDVRCHMQTYHHPNQPQQDFNPYLISYYSLHLHTEEWPGWVHLGGW